MLTALFAMKDGFRGAWIICCKDKTWEFTIYRGPHLSHHPVLTAVGSGRQDGYFYFHFTEGKIEGQGG